MSNKNLKTMGNKALRNMIENTATEVTDMKDGSAFSIQPNID